MLSLQMGGISQTVPHKFVEDVRYVQKIVHTWRPDRFPGVHDCSGV